MGIDPYQVYAGIDIQANGYNTPIRWDLFESGENSTHTSLGIYCPSWAYASASTLDEFHQKENTIWVNSKADPPVLLLSTRNLKTSHRQQHFRLHPARTSHSDQ